MPREIELQLQKLLAEKKISQADLAKRVGVGKATVGAYCANRWTVLDRTTLEQVADILQCDVASLLVSRESPFFAPYHNHGHPICVYLHRPDAKKVEDGRPVGQRDIFARDHVITLLEDSVPGMRSLEDSATTSQEFGKHAVKNCVVLGSPMVNKASEMAICLAFGAEPFTPPEIARLPFHFRVAAFADEPPVSSLIETSPDGRFGIWLREEKELLETDILPTEAFYAKEIKKGRDSGVIVVLNHQVNGEANVRKLVVLSGFAGVGTEAAAMALVERYRDLEPQEEERVVWGAIEVIYDKRANSKHRHIRKYKWRYRVGGRCPVAFTFRKPMA